MHHNFRKLKIWQVAMEIVELTYTTSGKFPRDEMFGLTSQVRRCAVSLPGNISEGAGRKSTKDFSHFLDMSLSSGNELITETLVAQKRKYISGEEAAKLVNQIEVWQKMTVTFQKRLDNGEL